MKKTISFLNSKDDLSILINSHCLCIYNTLIQLDSNKIKIDKEFLDYFKKCHLERPIFTLETSAVLLYNALKATKLPLDQIKILDYGAGVSTVYILAKKIGIKKVYYNDLMPNFIKLARQIDAIFDVKMDDYILGDSQACFKTASDLGYQINLVVSRNVIEHIYNLNTFFNNIYTFYPKAIVYNSTTANWNNPLTHIQHVWIHYSTWPFYKKFKINFVLNNYNLNEKQKQKLNFFIENTKAIGGEDFKKEIDFFLKNGLKRSYKKNYTNFCGVEGSWQENLISYSNIKRIHTSYIFEIIPGFWDTNYSFKLLNIMTSILNQLIKILPHWFGNILSPYIFIIAKPKK